jgi:hypothetical protein
MTCVLGGGGGARLPGEVRRAVFGGDCLAIAGCRKRCVQRLRLKFRPSSAAVATSREGYRSPRSFRVGQHRRWGQELLLLD